MTTPKVQYKGLTQKLSQSGDQTQIKYIGDSSSLKKMYDNLVFGEVHVTYGRLREAILQKEEGKFDSITIIYEKSRSSSASPPGSEVVYGEKSAVMDAGCIQLPLEHHENYKTFWNHYLFAPKGTAAPDWHETATTAETDTSQYVWGKSLSDRPDGFVPIAEPLKKGVTHYEAATYRITEVVKFKSSSEAGRYVANKLNKISSPENDFGITGGNWKCDAVSVSWQQKAWSGTLTFNRSGDDKGWDLDLYKEA